MTEPYRLERLDRSERLDRLAAYSRLDGERSRLDTRRCPRDARSSLRGRLDPVCLDEVLDLRALDETSRAESGMETAT
jgi:hypothetical protein